MKPHTASLRLRLFVGWVAKRCIAERIVKLLLDAINGLFATKKQLSACKSRRGVEGVV